MRVDSLLQKRFIQAVKKFLAFSSHFRGHSVVDMMILNLILIEVVHTVTTVLYMINFN
jgi:hypothetical protein